MGFGDVTLALGAGAVLGWYGWPTVMLGTFAGFLFGALRRCPRRRAAGGARDGHPVRAVPDRRGVRRAADRRVHGVGGDGVPCLDPTGRPVSGPRRPLPPFPNRGSAATFAVFDVPDEAALAERGAVTCVATVLAGRPAYRRR
ncbi:hypothetical protein SHIRM173S_10744 [Streptomyces hirsutus]